MCDGCDNPRFCALAMCGEAGEVANVVKKEWLGDGAEMLKLRDELGDVFAYWSILVRCAGFTLDEVALRSVGKAGFYIEELEKRREAARGWRNDDGCTN